MKDCHRCGKWRDSRRGCMHCGDDAPITGPAVATPAALLAASQAPTMPVATSSDTILSALEFMDISDEAKAVTPTEVVTPAAPPLAPEPKTVAVPVSKTVPAFPEPPKPARAAPVFPEPQKSARPAAPKSDLPVLSREEALSRWEAILDNSPIFADPTKPKAESVPEVPFLVPFDFEEQDIITTSPIGAAVDGNASAALDLAIDARFDVGSAPKDADPAVNLLVTLTPLGPPLLDPNAGPVAHVVLALDLSASMNAPDKYPVLTRALSGMLNDLRREDAVPVLLSVVVFAYGAETLFKAVAAKDLAPRQLLDALDRSPLRFGRYTDMVGALSRAGRIAHDSAKKNKAMPVRIYVMTDGRPQDVAGAREVMEKIHRMPVDIDGLGFGEDADIGCLKALITGGRGGTIKHVRSDTIEEAFGRIGDVAQRVVSPRAMIELELTAGVVGGMAYRFRPARHRYGDDAFEDGRRFSRDIGTLESGRTYSLLFQLRLPVGRGAETEVGRVTLRLPGFGGPRTFEKLISLPRHDGPPETEKDPEVAAARDVLEALDNDDPQATLRALKMRRQLYAQEHRDEHVLDVLDRAIAELERHGSLAALSQADHAALISHTLTRRAGGRKPVRKTEPAAS